MPLLKMMVDAQHNGAGTPIINNNTRKESKPARDFSPSLRGVGNLLNYHVGIFPSRDSLWPQGGWHPERRSRFPRARVYIVWLVCLVRLVLYRRLWSCEQFSLSLRGIARKAEWTFFFKKRQTTVIKVGQVISVQFCCFLMVYNHHDQKECQSTNGTRKL